MCCVVGGLWGGWRMRQYSACLSRMLWRLCYRATFSAKLTLSSQTDFFSPPFYPAVPSPVLSRVGEVELNLVRFQLGDELWLSPNLLPHVTGSCKRFFLPNSPTPPSTLPLPLLSPPVLPLRSPPLPPHPPLFMPGKARKSPEGCGCR